MQLNGPRSFFLEQILDVPCQPGIETRHMRSSTGSFLLHGRCIHTHWPNFVSPSIAAHSTWNARGHLGRIDMFQRLMHFLEISQFALHRNKFIRRDFSFSQHQMQREQHSDGVTTDKADENLQCQQRPPAIDTADGTTVDEAERGRITAKQKIEYRQEMKTKPCDRAKEQSQKWPVVFGTDACVEPRTVMIESANAFVTHSTVPTSYRRRRLHT